MEEHLLFTKPIDIVGIQQYDTTVFAVKVLKVTNKCLWKECLFCTYHNF